MSDMIKKISVLGAGIMGSGIAQVAAQAGFQVVMRDLEDKFLQQGLKSIKTSLHMMEEKGKLSSEEVSKILGRIKSTTDFEEAASDSDLVIEAIPENLDLKKQIFHELDETCPEHTILATNTSSLSITAIASATKRPHKVVGMHFANPVPVMPGIELIKGRDTSEETLEIAKEVINKMGKQFFVAADFPGFLGNRLLMLFINEAFNLVWQGIGSPEDIDKGCKLSFRHPMGPLELADLIGLDTVLAILDYLHKEISERYRPSPLLRQMVAAGHYGRKTGRGVYGYS